MTPAKLQKLHEIYMHLPLGGGGATETLTRRFWISNVTEIGLAVLDISKLHPIATL